MKLAYLANVRYPSERAHATQITHMCQSFALNGIETELIVNRRSEASKNKIDVSFDVDSKFSITRISHGWFYPRIKASFYLSELLFVLSFVLTKKYKSYDIIYARSEWIMWGLSFFVPHERLVWESHEAKLNLAARAVLKKGIKTVVISEGIFEAYEAQGTTKEQMVVAHDGIDESFFEPLMSQAEARRRLSLSKYTNIAMYIGGFDIWKGIETFFAAQKSCSGVTFVAVGGTASQVSEYQKRYPAVIFLGQRPYSELRFNQQAADVLVIPNTATNSLSEKYTSPLKLFAHMASGVPIVASDISSIKTVTGELVTLVAPDSSAALASGIKAVLQNYEDNKLRAQALKDVSLQYTWTKRAMNILDFFEHGNH